MTVYLSVGVVEGSLDNYLTGHCGSCHDGAGFECEEFEDCPNNSETRLEEAYASRRL